jgi:hypothetical protein
MTHEPLGGKGGTEGRMLGHYVRYMDLNSFAKWGMFMKLDMNITQLEANLRLWTV